MKLSSILLLSLLSSCVEPAKMAHHKYNLGDKILLKTGEQAVIIEQRPTYYFGNNAPSAVYVVRVPRTTGGNSSKMDVREFEIEKVVQ